MDLEKLQKSRNFWVASSMLMLGVLVGYLISPVKNGVTVKKYYDRDWSMDDCLAAEDYVEAVKRPRSGIII